MFKFPRSNAYAKDVCYILWVQRPEMPTSTSFGSQDRDNKRAICENLVVVSDSQRRAGDSSRPTRAIIIK